ncbi:4'-phosphopantetheinyl transferase superfamily protein [Cytophagaceae bacterium YF14B1]|uniref:4'-phosphopantetheinyl transferase superfamily protein n=1 Tax=Xanthocytophaga flava TaxID=3048013 RepID=A0AAE3QMI6_9BACT|nr:4'-phosphopantetheinyl transferase superfamily protein [Xanthocytophaga flavus]MDJ1479800.1 4'-phosphopantetheinyl transferase superfamily protein [Xanthocytophaga flavus]
MPLSKNECINDSCIWGIWEINETLEELYHLWHPNEHDTAYLLSISHEGRRKQTLASRILVQYLLHHWGKPYQGILKNWQGRPLLVEHEYYVSVSHTEKYAAAILHKSSPVGIDIEPVKEKMRRIIPRVLSLQEYEHAQDNIEKYCVYWCAKEALYKLYSQRQLSFRDQIYVENFDIYENGTLFGTVKADTHNTSYTIFYQKITSFIVAYTFKGEIST